MKSILSFILTLSSFSLVAQDCSRAFFSEYAEGSSQTTKLLKFITLQVRLLI